MDGNIICEESKRYVSNFISMHRLRPGSEQHGRLRATFGPSEKLILRFLTIYAKFRPPPGGAGFRVWGAELGLRGPVWGPGGLKNAKNQKISEVAPS